MKIIARKFRKNIAIIFAAAICALVIFFIMKNPGFFQASILSLEEKAFMNTNHRDAAYKTTDKHFEIFIWEKYKNNLRNFKGTIYYDPDTVQIDTQTFSGQWTIKISQSTIDSLTVNIANMDNIDTNEGIFNVMFSGKQDDILLGESAGKKTNGWKNFAVGNLSEFTWHSK